MTSTAPSLSGINNNDAAPSSTTTTLSSALSLTAGPAATLSAHSTRALTDRSYDKRKSGALEVEGLVKALVSEQKRTGVSCEEGVAKVVRRLANDFIVSSNSNARKGGLIGLAAVAIGLGPEICQKHGYPLDLLLPPVLKVFDDPEARVRYYATEALYNVVKLARGNILHHPEKHFNPIFHGLCKVFADVDPDVKSGAQLLDRLLKDVVSESAQFEVDKIIPLLQQYLKVKNPFIRQLLVSWIVALDAVPDIEVFKRFAFVLDGLLDMLSDANRPIREAAERALHMFLKEIVASAKSSGDGPKTAKAGGKSTTGEEESAMYVRAKLIPALVNILNARKADGTRQVRVTVMLWLTELVPLVPLRRGGILKTLSGALFDSVLRGLGEDEVGGGGEVISSLSVTSSSGATTNVSHVGPAALSGPGVPASSSSSGMGASGGNAPTAAALVPPAPPSTSSSSSAGTTTMTQPLTPREESDEMLRYSHRLDAALRSIALQCPEEIDEAAICDSCVNALRDRDMVRQRRCALEWISLLLDCKREETTEVTRVELVLPALVSALRDERDEIASLSLSAMARVARNEGRCDRVMGAIVAAFDADRTLLASRGAFIIRRLSSLLRPDTVCLVVARIVQARCDSPDVTMRDLNFISLLVQTFNLILLTAEEFVESRTALRIAWVGVLTEVRAGDFSLVTKRTAGGGGKTNNNNNTPMVSRRGARGLQSHHSVGSGSVAASNETDDMAVFTALFKCFCHNPVSALSLCLLGGAYGLAGRMVDLLSEVEITVELLMDADRLIRLLESPAFIHARIHLLRSGREFEPDLFRAMYGVLMLLPQKSDAFQVLSARLNAVASMQMAVAGGTGSETRYSSTAKFLLQQRHVSGNVNNKAGNGGTRGVGRGEGAAVRDDLGTERGGDFQDNNNNNTGGDDDVEDGTEGSDSRPARRNEARESLERRYDDLLTHFARVQALRQRCRAAEADRSIMST